MLTTRCPGCGTVFRITPEQLRARAGRVRCGHCQGIFDALENLRETAPPPAPPAAPEKTDTPAPAAEPITARQEPAPPAAAPTPLDVLLESVAAEPPRSRRWQAILWALACLLALGLLLGQAVYFLRTELVLWQPQLRPLLAGMCERLGCDIPLPRRAELAGIEASDLSPDARGGRLLVLTATLKNRAPFPQDYPHLELTLTDVRDQPILRKILAPADYLPEGSDLRAGFPANADLPVTLWLDPGETAATGYRLYLFYP